MDETLHREIEQFLFREARMLDERRWHDWLALFTDDVRYWMPVRAVRYPLHSKALKVHDEARHDERELSNEHEVALLDEDKASLVGRIACLDTGLAWAEDPPSRTRHIVTNVELEPAERADEIRVYCNFLVYRSRADIEQETNIGCRQDRLRRTREGWRIAYRKVMLDQAVMLAKNVSIFF